MRNLTGRYDNIRVIFIVKAEDEMSVCLMDEGGLYSYAMRDFSMFGIVRSDSGIEIIADDDEEEMIRKMKECL